MSPPGERPAPTHAPAQSFEDVAFALLLITAATIVDTMLAVLVVI